jgi:hypothetical protein
MLPFKKLDEYLDEFADTEPVSQSRMSGSCRRESAQDNVHFMCKIYQFFFDTWSIIICLS